MKLHSEASNSLTSVILQLYFHMKRGRSIDAKQSGCIHDDRQPVVWVRRTTMARGIFHRRRPARYPDSLLLPRWLDRLPVFTYEAAKLSEEPWAGRSDVLAAPTEKAGAI